MKTRSIANALTILATPFLVLRFSASTDGETRGFEGVTRTKANVEGKLGGQTHDLLQDLPVSQNEEVKTGRPGLRIKMPVAAIAIRGTYFWAGEINGGYGVILMHGVVEVSNAAGSVTLSRPSQGTLISMADVAPSEPAIWDTGKQLKALAGVAI